jgi:hypothetical protein
MAKKRKKKPTRRELARRVKIRKGLARYHRDVRAVKKATKLSYRESQQLIPPSVRRSGRRGAVLRRGDLLDLARERYAVTRETEYTGGGAAPEPQEEALDAYDPPSVSEGIKFTDLEEFMVEAARKKDNLEIDTSFYTLDEEALEQGPRVADIYREMGQAGDVAFKWLDEKIQNERSDKDKKKKKPARNYWRILVAFTVTMKYFLHGWIRTKGILIEEDAMNEELMPE